MRTKVWGRSKIKSPSLLSRKDQGRPGILLAPTPKSYVLLCLSRRVSQNLEPVIKRVESSLRCLTLVCYMTPSLVEHEVEGLGYAETAGASEELKSCCGCAKSRRASLLNEMMTLFAVPSQKGPARPNEVGLPQRIGLPNERQDRPRVELKKCCWLRQA